MIIDMLPASFDLPRRGVDPALVFGGLMDMKAALAELIGTFTLIFIGATAGA